VRTLPDDKRLQILQSVRRAFNSISSAEALEASNRGRTNLSGQEYLDTIRIKVAVAEATARMGAILGNGSQEQIEVLSHFGQTFGILNTVRDEYIDVFDADELKNRFKNECLPLPILLTFQDPQKKTAILHLLQQPATEETMEKILDLTMDSTETRGLSEQINTLMNQELHQILAVKNNKSELELFLRSTIEDL
jgi:geranylgeranyl pyrophosphate synthase